MPPYNIKREALRVRRAIESVSVEIWVTASGLPRSKVSTCHVERRLLLLATMTNDGVRLEAFRAARQAAHVYRETSDVLHGRTRASRFRGTHVEEWNDDLFRLQALWESSEAWLLTCESKSVVESGKER